MRVEAVRGAMAVDGLGTTLMHEQLADFKIPQYVVVSGRPLPRNPGGKLLKAQLRQSVEWGAPL
jgi:predicted metal-dependent phosphotriesterase family hydrolase